MTSHSDAIMQILSKNQAATVLFLEKVIREVDIGVHNPEMFGSLPNTNQFPHNLLSIL